MARLEIPLPVSAETHFSANSGKSQNHALDDGVRIGDLLREAREILALGRAETTPREALTLLGHVLGLDAAQIIARDDQRVASADAQRFQRLVNRRMQGEPVAYLIGRREFYGRDFAVDERVLIPRPETEHLVEAALDLELPGAPRILDIGTGSGAIAVTLACELQQSEILATDIDLGALCVARANARAHEVEHRVRFACADLENGAALDQVDLLVSNPPYVATGVDSEISFEVHDFEPHKALFAPGRGRGLIRRLLSAAEALRPGVAMVLEIGWDQGDWLRSQVEQSRHLDLLELIRDYGGHERTAVLRRR